MVAVEDVAGLLALAGRELGVSDWHDVTQASVDAFAATTRDLTAIHVDPERARAEGLPGTIAHGLYTLSLGPAMYQELLAVGDGLAGLSYGYDRVRYLNPLAVGDAVRMRATVAAVRERSDAVLLEVEQAFERRSDGAPVCAATALVHYRPLLV